MKTINLLLLETVENLGIVGDVVDVRPGYARNYLLPHGIAVKPTPEKVQELAARRAEVEAELKQQAAEQKAMIEKMQGIELTIERSANDSGILFGGVSQHDIAQALRDEGYGIEDRHVRIGETIKRLDSYDIPVVINKELKTDIKLWVVSDQPVEREEKTKSKEEAPAAEDADGE